MSEIEQTGNQPQEAATSTVAEPQQPFWDTLEDDTASETPEPNAEESTEEAPEPEAEPAEPEAEEEDADYLPDEQEKVFPDEVLAKYAKRYGMTMETLQSNPQMRQLVIDKINSDVLIKQQREASQQEEEESEEPTPAAPQTVAPQDRAQWLEQVVQSNLDPKSVSQMGHDFLVACGVDPESPDSEGILANSDKVGTVLAKGALDMFSTIGPQMQAAFVEQVFPGFTEMYQRSLYSSQWEKVSASAKDGSNLPKFGTPEFQQAITLAAAQIPDFESMVFTKNGVPLPEHQQTEKRYAMLVERMAGQKVTPQEVKTAIDTGKKAVRDADRSRAAGKVLGAGQSNKQFTSANAKDDFRADILAYNERQRSTPSRG